MDRLGDFAELSVSPKFSGHLGMCAAVRPAPGRDARPVFLSKNDADAGNEHVGWVRDAFSAALEGKADLLNRMAGESAPPAAPRLGPPGPTRPDPARRAPGAPTHLFLPRAPPQTRGSRCAGR